MIQILGFPITGSSSGNQKKLLKLTAFDIRKCTLLTLLLEYFYAILSSCTMEYFSTQGYKFLFIEVFWASCDINFVMPINAKQYFMLMACSNDREVEKCLSTLFIAGFGTVLISQLYDLPWIIYMHDQHSRVFFCKENMFG